jgi:hypothetical protein
MTVIVWRDGVLASDSEVSNDRQRVLGVRKVVRGHDGVLYGASGSTALCSEMLRWVDGGRVGVRPALSCGDASCMVLVVAGEGAVSIWTEDGVEDHGAAEYLAIGTGSAVALGALWMGATAVDAVRAAVVHGLYCGGDVQAVQL